MTVPAGLDNTHWATAASFVDYDRDGWLDLVVGNYVDYYPTLQCFDPAGAREFCGPQELPPTVTKLFHNRGATAGPGKVAFEDATVSSGFARTRGKVLGILCADLTAIAGRTSSWQMTGFPTGFTSTSTTASSRKKL